jgi:DNA polymerase-3 subunit alpha
MNSSFVHFHNHTEYSMLDGASQITPMLADA